MTMKWSAIVLAGSRPGGDPLAATFGTDLKALIPVAGEPMVRRPVAALIESDEVESVLVLAQQVDRIRAALPNDWPVTVERSADTIAETLLRICRDPATKWPLLVTTADHALLTPGMIHEFCWRSARSDLAIGVVSKGRLLNRLPETQRTWIPFKGGAFTGANLFVLRSDKVVAALEAWRSVEQDRKKAWKLIRSMGLKLFVRMLFRRLTIDQTLHRISVRLGVSIRAIRLSDALAAVDVDKPRDHEL
ncbi:MAG: nucleotidyltransferase family protein, partial [Sphingomicrobium sp.]